MNNLVDLNIICKYLRTAELLEFYILKFKVFEIIQFESYLGKWLLTYFPQFNIVKAKVFLGHAQKSRLPEFRRDLSLTEISESVSSCFVFWHFKYKILWYMSQGKRPYTYLQNCQPKRVVQPSWKKLMTLFSWWYNQSNKMLSLFIHYCLIQYFR